MSPFRFQTHGLLCWQRANCKRTSRLWRSGKFYIKSCKQNIIMNSQGHPPRVLLWFFRWCYVFDQNKRWPTRGFALPDGGKGRYRFFGRSVGRSMVLLRRDRRSSIRSSFRRRVGVGFRSVQGTAKGARPTETCFCFCDSLQHYLPIQWSDKWNAFSSHSHVYHAHIFRVATHLVLLFCRLSVYIRSSRANDLHDTNTRKSWANRTMCVRHICAQVYTPLTENHKRLIQCHASLKEKKMPLHSTDEADGRLLQNQNIIIEHPVVLDVCER